MKWLNPFFLAAMLKGYIAEHFVAWHVSSVFSYIGAAGLSLVYPPWARDLVEVAWPEIKGFAGIAWDVFVELLNTS